MSTSFVFILWFPLIPVLIGTFMWIYVKRKKRPDASRISAPFGKIFGWGLLITFAFVIFVVASTIITDSPQGPLMLLFSSIPFAIGELIGLGIWIVKERRNFTPT